MKKRLMFIIVLTLFTQLLLPVQNAASLEAASSSDQIKSNITAPTLVFFVDLGFAYAGGKRVEIPKPSRVNQTVMLPVKPFAELTGGVLDWNPENKSITLGYGSTTITLTLNNNQIAANGKSEAMPVAVKSVNGVSYAPAVSLSKALGLTIAQKDNVLVIGQSGTSLNSILDSWHNWYQWRQKTIPKLSDIVIDIGIKPVVQNDRIYYMDHEAAMLHSVKLDGSNRIAHEEYGYNYYDSNKNKYLFGDTPEILLPEGASLYEITDGFVYYFTDELDFWSMRLDGTEAHKLARINEYPTKIKILNGYVYYTMKQGLELRRVKNDGTDNRVLIQHLEQSPYMRIEINNEYALTQGWMEDGIQIVNNRLYYIDYGNRQLYELNLQTLKATKLTNFAIGVDSRYMSIDGDWIYFNVTQYNNGKKTVPIYRVNLVTQKLEKLLNHGYLSHVLGGWIYYNDTHIYRMTTDGRTKQQITKGKLTDVDHIWHVTNDWIIFNSYYGSRNMGTFKIKTDGTRLTETRRGII